MENITFRQATIDDAPFVALVMMEAVGVPMMEQGEMPSEELTSICLRPDTLYSYKNATIAEIDGKPVAGLIAYNGKGYHEVKKHTFSLVKVELDFNPMEMDDETKEGEYYLDSLAVLPDYRGKGFGRMMLEKGIEIAREKNLLPILACDPHNDNAYQLYRNIGFNEDGKLYIFGKNYLRMVFFP